MREPEVVELAFALVLRLVLSLPAVLSLEARNSLSACLSAWMAEASACRTVGTIETQEPKAIAGCGAL